MYDEADSSEIRTGDDGLLNLMVESEGLPPRFMRAFMTVAIVSMRSLSFVCPRRLHTERILLSEKNARLELATASPLVYLVVFGHILESTILFVRL